MAQSLSKVLLHVVFSTKNREKTIGEHLRSALHAYLAGICRAKGAEAYRVGGTDDHVHIACTLPRTLTMARLVEEIRAAEINNYPICAATHPAWRRCSSSLYRQYDSSSRLARRATHHPSWDIYLFPRP